jgi:hypothetical protein
MLGVMGQRLVPQAKVMHLHKDVQEQNKDVVTLTVPDHNIIILLEALCLLICQELKLKVLLACMIEATV